MAASAFAFAAIGVPLLTAALILVPRLGLFRATGARHAVLPKPFSRLDGRDVLVIILLGLAPPLAPSSDGRGFDLAALSVTSTLAIDDDDLLRFDAATAPRAKKGTTTARAEPSSSKIAPDPTENNRSLLIPGLINPLMAILLANRKLPVHPFGAVNTRNTFTFLDPEACRHPTRNWSFRRKTIHYLVILIYTGVTFAFIDISPISDATPHHDLSMVARQISDATAIRYVGMGLTGIGLVPLAHRYGRRPLYLFSVTLQLVTCIWLAVLQSKWEYYAACGLSGAGAAVSQALVPICTMAWLFLLVQTVSTELSKPPYNPLGPARPSRDGGQIPILLPSCHTTRDT
ncbi:hypothetical protein MY11210_001695 [Beauveria gryllotalpidicola]